MKAMRREANIRTDIKDRFGGPQDDAPLFAFSRLEPPVPDEQAGMLRRPKPESEAGFRSQGQA